MSSTTSLLPRSGQKLHFSKFCFSQNHSTLVTKHIQVSICLNCNVCYVHVCRIVCMCVYVSVYIYTHAQSHQHQKWYFYQGNFHNFRQNFKALTKFFLFKKSLIHICYREILTEIKDSKISIQQSLKPT